MAIACSRCQAAIGEIMKKILLGMALASASVGISLPAHAANSADLTVKGQITPPACDLSFTDGTVDFGNRTFGTLDLGGTILPTKTTNLIIECRGATRVSFSVADNRPGSAISDQDVNAWPNIGVVWQKTIWGLGTAGNSDAKIGGLVVSISPSTQIDRKPLTDNLRILNAPLGTNAWETGTYLNYGYLDAAQHYSFGQPNKPAAVSTVTMPLYLAGVIARPTNLPAVDEINLDGSLTFSLHYL